MTRLLRPPPVQNCCWPFDSPDKNVSSSNICSPPLDVVKTFFTPSLPIQSMTFGPSNARGLLLSALQLLFASAGFSAPWWTACGFLVFTFLVSRPAADVGPKISGVRLAGTGVGERPGCGANGLLFSRRELLSCERPILLPLRSTDGAESWCSMQ